MKSPKHTSLTNIALWGDKAEDWQRQVEGDRNRRFNSDPVPWKFLGPVRGCSVLDAGCGTGYLSRRLSAEGARVVGVDFAPRMIDVAKHLTAEVRLEVDSCATLATVPDASFDKLVSNYVLQDLPELDDAARAFHRVLRPGGLAAFAVATGKVQAAHKKRRRRKEFLDFMDEVVAAYPKRRLEVILDNLNTHKKNEDWPLPTTWPVTGKRGTSRWTM